jgi:hypothetical protein
LTNLLFYAIIAYKEGEIMKIDHLYKMGSGDVVIIKAITSSEYPYLGKLLSDTSFYSHYSWNKKGIIKDHHSLTRKLRCIVEHLGHKNKNPEYFL